MLDKIAKLDGMDKIVLKIEKIPFVLDDPIKRNQHIRNHKSNF